MAGKSAVLIKLSFLSRRGGVAAVRAVWRPHRRMEPLLLHPGDDLHAAVTRPNATLRLAAGRYTLHGKPLTMSADGITIVADGDAIVADAGAEARDGATFLACSMCLLSRRLLR